MIYNFLKVAIRHFLKKRAPFILNITGLAIGLASSVFVYLYVHDEFTYDTQHPDPQNTYRIVFKQQGSDGEELMNASVPHGWGQYMQQNIKGIKSYSSTNRAGWSFSFFIAEENGDQRVVLSPDAMLIMKNYAQLFYLELLEGDRNSMMEHPNDMLISQSAARELFGDEKALNRQIELSHPYYSNNKKVSVVVRGIYRDLPDNMHLGRFVKYMLHRDLQKELVEGLPGNPSFEDRLSALWWPAWSGSIYFQTEPGTDLEFVRKQLNAVVNEEIKKKAEKPFTIDAQFIPVTDIHFSDVPYITLPEMTGNKQYIHIFLTIGAFILLISCINYINLSTAQSTQRAKEVAIRKALGSYKRQMMFQFLQETFLITGLSTILGLFIVIVFLPNFSDFSNKDFAIADIFSATSLSVIALLWILISVLSGLYPAFYLSSFNTVRILKGDLGGVGGGGNALRKSLVVFQFVIALVLIVFTLVVIRQMTSMINTDLNKSGDHILSIRYGNIAPLNKLNVFKNELARDPDLRVSSFGNHLPRREGSLDLSFGLEVTVPDRGTQEYTWDMMCIGADFPAVFGLGLVAGRFFDTTGPVDSTEILVNEEVARQLHVDATDLIGLKVRLKDVEFKKEYFFIIRGVLKDFKYESVNHRISPLVLSLHKDRVNNVIYYVKLPQGKIPEKVGVINEIWKKVMPPDVGMSYWFVSDDFNELYFEENALFDLSRVFTVVGIITTCIGLFAMSMFLAQRRSREMAIRKVAGAGSYDVFKRMVLPFVKLMAIACMIALPISYYLSNMWLDNFVYRVEVSGMIVVLSVSLLFMVTLFTVTFFSLKVANEKPVTWLKQE